MWNDPLARHIKKAPSRVNITLAKGSVHIAVQRGFVDYVLHDPRALIFREWVKDTFVPDETFFTSLNASPQLGVPGAYKGISSHFNCYKPISTVMKGIHLIGHLLI